MTIRTLLLTLLLPSLLAAQPAEDEIAVEPIRCWWKSDRSAVHFGERFVLTLTCRVVETSAVTVSPSLTALEPGAVLLTPFEAVGGRRYEDIVAPPYRYLQFDYDVRFLGEGAFGTDVAIPPLTVTYAVQAAAGGGAQGREQRYLLPAIPLRVVSLAPQGATDIRDASPDTFGVIESHRFRTTAALVGTGLFAGLALVLVAVAGVRAAAGRRRVRATVVRPVGAPTVLQGCLRTLREVRAEAARDGWTAAHARRAATAFRIAGAAAMGRPIAQVPVPGRKKPDEGQVVVRRGLIRRRPVLVSAPTTPDAITRHLAQDDLSAGDRATLEPIEAALRTCSVHAYGRNGTIDGAALDAALDAGTRAVRRLQMTRLWPRRRDPDSGAVPGAPAGAGR
jgi:hypothetical protein